MSDKLIEIAKECGAEPLTCQIKGKGVFVTINQLHAYTEKVCKQMVEALDGMMQAHNGVYVMPGENHKNIAYRKSEKALTAYTEIMGDKK